MTLSPEVKDAFNILKQKCMTAPVLAFADLEKPFLLETDASALGLGAVLQQVQADGKLHPVAYASHALRKGEKNYHSSKIGVFGTEVGSYGTIQRISLLQAVYSEDG